ncbi:substrate-binding domain-containing protein [Paenibacillus sp. F411]|uniref:substrate-binding domain-containing protein n=1 Tax=Paenibacillus sp. F411 TaxID=2820239 RepID=UPI001AAEDED3|nr:substrate-binding domain-containing protein [Paenibacillus sp. F411]MBO2946036.1 substrate-binding domain-containing protein [Paenibacillus sp. F411]
MIRNNVTMRDIAEKLNVSVVTVSKALNDKEGVSDQLKYKIKETASELGYRFNLAAKSMKEGFSYNIGVVIPARFAGPNQSFYLQFYQTIARALGDFNYYGILYVLSLEEEQELLLPRLYHERKVDGFIILGQISSEYIELLKTMETPYVFLDFYTDETEVDSVITDNYYAMYEMTNYLIKNGHRDIAFVGSIHSTSSIQDRFLGYYKSLLEHRIPLVDEYVIPDRDESGNYIQIQLPKQMPTAFVCNCDQVAYNVIGVLVKNGYSVPDDCSVAGFDNDLYATISKPNLTTIEVDMEKMSETAIRAVVSQIKDDQAAQGRILVKGRIVYRDSVKPLISREMGAEPSKI